MFKIKTMNAISPIGLSQFPKEHYEISSEIDHPDVILVRSHDLKKDIIPTSIKAIGRAGAGLNNVPVKEMTQRGIPVFYTPGANANAVRELVIAGMLLSCRNICQAWNYVSHINVSADQLDAEVEKNKKQFVGFELMGKTLGIIGLGSIGVKVANAAISLGMNVIGHDPTITVNRAWELSSQVKPMFSIDELLANADFVSFHVPLTDTTRNMINSNRFQIMKPGVTLLNFARDGIIDNEALLDALQTKKVLSYVTDFPSAQLIQHPRVISLPHLGASTLEAEENCAVMIANQVRRFLEFGSITNAINFPSIEVPLPANAIRLSIVNANIPNMVAQISSKLADASLNIASLANQSLHDIAYTLIDINSTVSDIVLQQIKSIDGVLQVRML